MKKNVFLVCHYTKQITKGKNLRVLMANKNLVVDVKHIISEDNKNYKFIKYFITEDIIFEKDDEDDLTFIDTYLSLCVYHIEKILSKEYIYDAFVTWTNPPFFDLTNSVNDIQISIEPVSHFIYETHDIGVIVDYRFKNLVEAYFPLKVKNMFMEENSKIYLNFSKYIRLRYSDEFLHDIKKSNNYILK